MRGVKAFTLPGALWQTLSMGTRAGTDGVTLTEAATTLRISRDAVKKQLALLGITDRPSSIWLIGLAPYDDPAATLEFARRKLAEKKRRA